MNYRKFSYYALFLMFFVVGSCSEEEKTDKTKDSKSEKRQSERENSSNSSAEEPLEENVIVAGNVKDGFKASMVVEANTDQGAHKIGQGFTDGNGDFVIKGAIRDMGLYQIRLEQNLKEGEEPKVVPMTLVPGDSVYVQLDFNKFNENPKFSNTVWAEPLNKYMAEMKSFVDWQKTISNPQDYEQEELMEMVKKEKKAMDDFTVKSIKKDPENPINILLMTNLMPMMGYEHFDPVNLEVLKIMKGAYREAYPNNPVTENVLKQIEQVEKGYQEFKQFSEDGVAPEIAKNDPEGNTRKLSDLKGKYVLVDFWASWCGPCRVENPNVVKLYDKYKDKNFEIFSVSLDQEKNRWVKAIEADGLKWDNHVSDLKGWQSDVVQSYKFQGIPHTVLLNPEGEIIATKLRGPSLERKLKEIFGE